MHVHKPFLAKFVILKDLTPTVSLRRMEHLSFNLNQVITRNLCFLFVLTHDAAVRIKGWIYLHLSPTMMVFHRYLQ